MPFYGEKKTLNSEEQIPQHELAPAIGRENSALQSMLEFFIPYMLKLRLYFLQVLVKREGRCAPQGQRIRVAFLKIDLCGLAAYHATF